MSEAAQMYTNTGQLNGVDAQFKSVETTNDAGLITHYLLSETPHWLKNYSNWLEVTWELLQSDFELNKQKLDMSYFKIRWFFFQNKSLVARLKVCPTEL